MPIPSCPPEALALMTVPIQWERSLGTDGHGQPVYAPAVTLKCWLEEHGMIQGGLEVMRKPDGTSVAVQYDLFFSGDDERVRSFTYQDRFTLPDVVAGATLQSQPAYVSTKFGPNFDNRNPWLVQVTL